jgi:hypothetical protein
MASSNVEEVNASGLENESTNQFFQILHTSLIPHTRAYLLMFFEIPQLDQSTLYTQSKGKHREGTHRPSGVAAYRDMLSTLSTR